jgi:hypothetical protein
MQRRIDSSLRQVEGSGAPPLQLLDDPIPVRGLVGDDRKQQEIEVPFERLGAHRARMIPSLARPC